MLFHCETYLGCTLDERKLVRFVHIFFTVLKKENVIAFTRGYYNLLGSVFIYDVLT
jgi:hypothetical protein